MDKQKGKVQPPDTTMGHIVSASDEPLPEVDLHTENLLQDYVIDQPVPLEQKATSGNVKKIFWRRYAALITVVVLILAAGTGVAVWAFWQNQQAQDEQEIADGMDVQEPDELDQAVDLEFDDEDVVNTYEYIKRVIYQEPFVTFYPIGEITRADLSEEQLALLRGEETLPELADAQMYIHHLYAAERDGDKINLYEAVVVSEPAACETPGEDWCREYRTLSGVSLDEVYDANQWWVHHDEMDHFRWTFVENTEGTYTLQTITSVKHLAENS